MKSRLTAVFATAVTLLLTICAGGATAAPMIEITSPADGSHQRLSQIPVTFDHAELTNGPHCDMTGPGGYVWDDYCNGGASFMPAMSVEGVYVLTVTGPTSGGSVQDTVSFVFDKTAPVVTVLSPAPGQVFVDDTPELSFDISGLSEGVPAQCHFDDQPWTACDAAFGSSPLAEGSHVLTIRATDRAGNETVVSVPFSIDLADPAPTRSPDARWLSPQIGKVRRGRFNTRLRFEIVPPAGAPLLDACQGSARVTARVSVKGAKRIERDARLRLAEGRCVASVTLSLPARYKRKLLTVQAVFPGNGVIDGFRLTRSVRRL